MGKKFYWDLEKTHTTLNKQLLSNSHLNNPQFSQPFFSQKKRCAIQHFGSEQMHQNSHGKMLLKYDKHHDSQSLPNSWWVLNASDAGGGRV